MIGQFVPIYQGGLLAQAFEDSQRGTYKNIQLHAIQRTYTMHRQTTGMPNTGFDFMQYSTCSGSIEPAYPFNVGKLVLGSTGINGSVPETRPSHMFD